LINKSVKNVSLIYTVHDIKLSQSQFSHPCLSPNNMDFVSQNNNVQNASFINSITESNKCAMNVNSDFVSGPFSSRLTNFIIDKKKYQDKLAEALIDVNHLQGNRILSIIRMHECLSYLPKDIRTLLCTPRAVPYLLKVSPGEYLHIGVEAALLRTLELSSPQLLLDRLEIDISTDDAQLDKNGKNQIWPIQCRIAANISIGSIN